jgi:dTDP-4-dehydrorhamnose reductase
MVVAADPRAEVCRGPPRRDRLMRVLVTGRDGQVVRALIERSAAVPTLELIAVGRPELDLAEPGSAAAVVSRLAPDVVVSAAAYTAVDQAEDEPELAQRINGAAAGELAAAARAIDASIIHLSTDYVFDGCKAQPYVEQDPVGPIGAYGRSKLAGEELVRAAAPDHLILRTAWVYSPWGKNFVRTMMTLAQTRDELKVVADQQGNPTNALDIADAVLAVIGAWQHGGRTGMGETFHFAGAGDTDWCEFAKAIFAECRAIGLPSAEARPIATADYPTKAVRPANSRLDTSKFEAIFGHNAPDWRHSLRDVVRRLGQA